jgi:predicted GNAT family acetyltransferase
MLHHFQMQQDADRRGEPIEDEHASTLQFAAKVVESNIRNRDEPYAWNHSRMFGDLSEETGEAALARLKTILASFLRPSTFSSLKKAGPARNMIVTKLEDALKELKAQKESESAPLCSYAHFLAGQARR